MPKLGLVVIDEQHKFGVRQRANLRASGESPHYLVMTATPIPRTVAMTLYGDLDVSTIRGYPPGRQEVHTYVVTDELRERWWEFFRAAPRGPTGICDYADGRGVRPRRADQCARSVRGAVQRRIGGVPLAAGARSDAPEEKQAAMDAFRERQAQVLVATSVVEVGIDVPNASVMTIENAERFGMASLHQLRGRVGRGRFPGYVALCPGSDSEEARRRVRAVEQTSDGFELAEIDFQMRGPGELLGTRQHGIPPLRIADLRRDQAMLMESRQAADQLISADPQLSQAEHAALRRQVIARYGQVLQLGDVG